MVRECPKGFVLSYFRKGRELFLTEVGRRHINSTHAPPSASFSFSPILRTWPWKQPYCFEPMERQPQSHGEQRLCCLVELHLACSIGRVRFSMLPLGELVSLDTISSSVSVFRGFSKVVRSSYQNLFSQCNLMYWNSKTEVLSDHWPINLAEGEDCPEGGYTVVAVHLCLALTKQAGFSTSRTQTFMTSICRPMEFESSLHEAWWHYRISLWITAGPTWPYGLKGLTEPGLWRVVLSLTAFLYPRITLCLRASTSF